MRTEKTHYIQLMITTNNFFVLQPPLIKSKRKRIVDRINKGLERFGFWYRLKPVMNPGVEMNTIEHRLNFYHVITSVIDREIEGDVVELGSFTGQCATIFQKILNMHGSDKPLHLFDSFEKKFDKDGCNIEDMLRLNFKQAGLKQPIIHKGRFEKTIPQELPDTIAFAHIDCGWGGDVNEHQTIMLHCLQHLYRRLSKGAICVLMDYHDRLTNDPGMDCNPGVKLACDMYFQNKPERIISLYANQGSHAYFIKK